MDSILTTVIAASSRALVTLEEVKAEIGITVSTQNVQLARLIARASAAVESHCGRIFARQSYSEAIRLDRCRPSILLAQYPLISIGGVTEDGTALDAGEHENDGSCGLLYRLDGSDCRLHWQIGKIVVAYDAGYQIPGQSGVGDALPADITEAVIETVKDRYSSAGRDPRLRSETHEGVGAASYLDPRAGDGSLPARAAELLWPYVKVAV